MNIGLYFGSFNPIHIGHLAIANYMVEFSDLDEVWFVVSPHNPLKNKNTLLNDYDRLEMVRLAINDFHKFKVSNIEFSLPQPSYTVNTLAHLKEKYPDKTFNLIMGSDNLCNFHKWKNNERIIENHKLYVYPRKNETESQFSNHKNVVLINAPEMEISSTSIREAIKNGKDLRFFLPEKVYQMIDKQGFYSNLKR